MELSENYKKVDYFIQAIKRHTPCAVCEQGETEKYYKWTRETIGGLEAAPLWGKAIEDVVEVGLMEDEVHGCPMFLLKKTRMQKFMNFTKNIVTTYMYDMMQLDCKEAVKLAILDIADAVSERYHTDADKAEAKEYFEQEAKKLIEI